MMTVYRNYTRKAKKDCPWRVYDLEPLADALDANLKFFHFARAYMLSCAKLYVAGLNFAPPTSSAPPTTAAATSRAFLTVLSKFCSHPAAVLKGTAPV